MIHRTIASFVCIATLNTSSMWPPCKTACHLSVSVLLLVDPAYHRLLCLSRDADHISQRTNQLGAEGAEILAAALMTNNGLRSLNLFNNRIQARGTSACCVQPQPSM
jgi:hypothetical protein